MKRSIKKNSGVYTFLDTSGLLEHGTGEDIEQARKQYWSEYRKKYKKIKRQESKSFEVLFNLKEVRIITEKAKKYHSSTTNYIKQSALLNKQGIVDQIAFGEIRELVIRHHNTLLTFTEENELPQQIGNNLIEQISQIEKKILGFFCHLNNCNDN